LAVLGGIRSNTLERVETPEGFDVIVGRTAAAVELAARVGAAAVTAAEVASSPVPTVAGASLVGLALALATRLERSGSDVLRVGFAHPGGPATGNLVLHFPPPVGRLRGSLVLDDPFRVVGARTKETWGAALVETNTGDQALVDDYIFLASVCLAAAVCLVPPAGIVKVWDAPSAYLSKAEQMGLVAAGNSRI
jgi:hypothetical protein